MIWRDHSDEPVRLNWTAILSITGSLAVTAAIWAGLVRVVTLLVK